MDVNNGYAFPPPSLFINVQTEARRTLFFTNWLRHRTALIFRISTPLTDASPIGNQLWRTLLGQELELTTDDRARHTKSANRKQAIIDILASCINTADGISINLAGNNNVTWQGSELIPDQPIPPEIARQILWELSELNFRCELVGLDRRSHNDKLSANHSVSNERNITLPVPSTREDLLGRCFVGTSMLDIELQHAGQGLACPLWANRYRYILALRDVMVTWSGFRSYAASQRLLHLLDPPLFSAELTECQVNSLETLVTGYYTQAFFNHFGRAPVLPRHL